MIPPIIHQSWKTERVPEKWQPLQKSWKAFHPTYDYQFWTDQSNRDFIARHCLDYLDLYDHYPLAIERAELARYLVLRHFGGVYVDMDVEALCPIGELLSGAELVFGLEPASHVARPGVRERGLRRIVCNAFMASIPHHPFWDHLLACLRDSKENSTVLDATGTFLLTRACDTYPRAHKIVFVPAAQLYPLDNEEVRKLDAGTMRSKLSGAYAVHYWWGSWLRESQLVTARNRIAQARRKSIGAGD